MQIIRGTGEMRSQSDALRREGRRIVLVPTMGSLHEGHLSLIRIAREHGDVVVVSIFVNPTQFGPNEDYNKYPRDAERDLELCRQEQVDIVFMPEASSIYSKSFSTFIDEGELGKGLCGISRPHHFRGVCTIVAKLFNLVGPHVAVFGQKDAQQHAILRKMVKDLDFPVEMVIGPIVREADGLAMSSRNRYLQGAQRVDALTIYKALSEAQRMVKEGQRNVDRVLAEITHILSSCRRIRVIYVAIVHPDTMQPMKEIVLGQTLICVAVWVDEVRLIDNIVV